MVVRRNEGEFEILENSCGADRRTHLRCSFPLTKGDLTLAAVDLKDKASKKEFLTTFGQITLERRYYYNAKAAGGIYPVDEEWGMEG